MQTPPPFDWLQPDWPAPAWVGAVCTTRQGGVSQVPYDSMNLGDHVQDDAQAVAHNRARLQRYIGGEAVFLQQVHGYRTLYLPQDAIEPADASCTTQTGLACVMMVADCLPVLLTHSHARIVGAAHAGWRGLAGGVLESVLHTMQQAVHPTEGHWMAWLGPCICPTAFEVGDEVRAAFCTADWSEAKSCFTPSQHKGKWLTNLPKLARLRLQRAGVVGIYGNDASASWCTYGQPEKFYSYRRHAQTGRLAAAVWLR